MLKQCCAYRAVINTVDLQYNISVIVRTGAIGPIGLKQSY